MTRDETVALFWECETKRAAARLAALGEGKSECEAEVIAHEAAKAHWNAWAEKMLAKRKAMEEAGRWATGRDLGGELEPHNQETRAWVTAAQADFSRCLFLVRGSEWTKETAREKKEGEDTGLPIKSIRLETDYVDFSGFIFPGNALFGSIAISGSASFESTNFSGTALFEGADFSNGARFESAKFFGDARFRSATFSGDARFGSTNFFGDAQFRSATFSGNTRFGSTKFFGDAQFRSATFSGDSSFKSTTFSGYCSFRRAAFSNSALFESATFLGATFENATFGDARFGNATFSDNASFDGATFSGEAEFLGVKFKDRSSFKGVHFSGDADFEDVLFEGYADFDSAEFKNDADFQSVSFENHADFDKAQFAKRAHFFLAHFHSNATFNAAQFNGERAALRSGDTLPSSAESMTDFFGCKVERAFDLSKSVCADVPDFRQADFKQAPDLDDVSFALPDFCRGHLADLIPQYRAIRRMAIQGADYDREQMAFKGELRSRRWTVDKPWHLGTWFGLLYDGLADCGRSMFRPLLLWLALLALFPAIYLENAGVPVRDWQSDCETVGMQKWERAVSVSMSSGIPVIGGSRSEEAREFQACVRSKAVSLSLTVLQVGQSLVSAVLIFLLLLAVKNRFKIK